MKLKLPILRKTFLILWLTGLIFHATAQQNKPFQIKGFHLDLRIQVMKMPALKTFALNLSKNGVNTLLMEWEGSYPFENEPLVANRYAYKREEIKSFIAYCKSIGIDVIPLQQSFGHVEYILRNSKYAALREDEKDYSQINPTKEKEAKALFSSLYKDLISTHSSPYIHIGGDETYLLGHSEDSKKKVAAVGMGRLYGDYIKMLCELVVSLGKRPVVWADIALKYPEVLKTLPKSTIFMDWNYGWALDRFGDHAALMKLGFEIWGSPAIRSAPDNYYLTDWVKHFNNIRDFIPQAKNLGYNGMVMTSWSTSGIYSPIFESATAIIDLHAVRRVYPITGFNILVAAYLKNMDAEKPIVIKEFVESYCKENYSFTAAQAAAFWSALTKTPFEVNQAKPDSTNLTVNQLLDSAKAAVQVLNDLKPLKNHTEFEHYRLMAAIRAQYLEYMCIEELANSPSCTENELATLAKRLKALNTGKIDRKFSSLHQHTLYPSEIKQENRLRNIKINLLLQRITKQK
ncbi:beta-N-acetylhexosaminidase [Pedobacter sp.]|uniref:beta-N-acetylhexosaminidase n=1 Tax=Pedobacter sp. TaxID=1411316 RepID=UPI003D7FD464